MKTKWEIKKLGEVCEVLDSKRKPITKKNRISGEYPYYGATGILDYVHEYIFDEKLVLIGEDGAKWGKGENTSFIVEGKYWVNNHAHVIRPNRTKILDEWIVYFLNSNDLTPYITGLTVPKLNQEKLRSITLPVPPLPIQKQIVKILDEAFEKISKAKENAETNFKNSQEVFESYLQKVFEEKGANWSEERIFDICEIKPAKKEAREKLNEEDLVSFAPMEDLGINQKYLLPDKERKLKQVQGSYTYFTNNCVLLAKITPCFENGKLGIAKNLKNGIGFGSSEFTVFRTDNKIEPEFLYYFLLRKKFRDEGVSRMTGAVGHKRVSKEFIENYVISFPDSNMQKKLISKLDQLSEQSKKLESIYSQKLKDLEDLKQSILQKAFKGELTKEVLV